MNKPFILLMLIVLAFTFCGGTSSNNSVISNDKSCWFYFCDYELNFTTLCAPEDTVFYHLQEGKSLKILINPSDWSGEYFELDSNLTVINQGVFLPRDSVNFITGITEDPDTGDRRQERVEYRVIGDCD